MLPSFVIHQPSDVAGALELAGNYGDDAAFYAGGTELLLAMKLGVMQRRHLIDIKALPGMSSVAGEGTSTLSIGALVTHRSIERSPVVRRHIPTLGAMSARIGNPRVRASGTWGGNLAFGEPRSDVATLAMCLDATCHIEGATGTRQVALTDFVLGPYETDLGETELLSSVTVRVPEPGSFLCYRKFQVQERPVVGVGVLIETADAVVSNCRVVVGAATPVATRCRAVEQVLAGQARTGGPAIDPVLDDALTATLADLDVDSDGEASADYKRHLAAVFIRRAVAAWKEGAA